MSATDTSRGTIAIPEGQHELPPSTTEEIDRAVADLRANVTTWIETSVADRAVMLRQAIQDTLAAAPSWTLAAAVHKGIDRDSPLMGEDWISGPYATIRNLRLLAETLDDIQATPPAAGDPDPPRRAGGRRRLPDELEGPARTARLQG